MELSVGPSAVSDDATIAAIQDIVLSKVLPMHSNNKMHKIRAYETEEILVGMMLHDKVWSLCSKDLLLLDADLKDGATTESVEKQVQTCATIDGRATLFQLYETDRGFHAVLLSHAIPHDSREAMELLKKLHCDADYIAFSVVGGYGMRLNPKKTGDFVARRTRRIGGGEALPALEQRLRVKDELVAWFLANPMSCVPTYNADVDYVTDQPCDAYVDKVRRATARSYGKKACGVFLPPSVPPWPHHSLCLRFQHNCVFWFDPQFGIWAVGTPDVLMIDFDVGADFTRTDAVDRLKNYCAKNPGALFHLYETDRGLHAFRSDKLCLWSDTDTLAMLQELGNDNAHCEFVRTGSHCVRVSPRIQPDQRITGVLVSRPGYAGIAAVGTGLPHPRALQVISMLHQITEEIKRLFCTHRGPMTQLRFVRQLGNVAPCPEPWLLEEVANFFQGCLQDYNQISVDERVDAESITMHVDRYAGLLAPEVRKEKNKHSVSDVLERAALLEKTVAALEKRQTVTLGGPRYPFRFGHDGLTHIFFLATYDILMVDFDIKDGIARENVPAMLERFLAREAARPENDRITLSPMRFRLCDTDNGVHAFLVSHRISHDSNAALAIQWQLCSDPWYMAYCRVAGFHIRMSPKVLVRRGALDALPQEAIESQFVQKQTFEGTVRYVGDGRQDEFLDQFVTFLADVQACIIRAEGQDFGRRLLADDPTTLEKASRITENLWRKLPRRPLQHRAARHWAT